MSTSNQTQAQQTVSVWLTSYGDELLSWAIFKTSNKETAEDLVQETLLSAFKAFDKFNEGTNPKTWLFTILNNKIIDYYRASNTTKSFNESELQGKNTDDSIFDINGYFSKNQEPLWGSSEKHLLDNEEFIAVLKMCMDALPTNWKNVIVSKYVQNKKGKLICQELDITSSNLWQMAHRAKLQLKTCLDQHWNNN
jgi:RNA polymerase sigma-70 factor (ECF subfamily)